ncbi:MAG: N,N-dimethylformamidase beta subunit family domain-containing protein [Thermoleophilaceae bacterium]
MGLTAAPPRRVVGVLFAAFVVATAGAFFVTQRLKRSTPIVERVFFRRWLSPNGDGRKDTALLRFDLPKAQRVTVSVVNSRGEEVRTLADDRFMHRGRQPFTWDGRDDHGIVVPDGVYRLRVGLREEGRSITAPRQLFVDTTPPRPRIVAVTPPVVMPGAAGAFGRARVRFGGLTKNRPVFRVWRTDDGKVRPVARFEGRRGRRTATWDGLVAGRPAPEGAYAVSVTVQDSAGNEGSAPAVLPPTRAFAVAHSGVTVSYLSLTGELVPVKPGAIARFAIGPVARPLRWRLALVGSGGAIRKGVSHGTRLAVRIPRDAQPAIYSVLVTSVDGRHAAWPVVVGGRGNAGGLVVVPTITWQGQNPVDSNQDGFPDTLDSGGRVPLARPFAASRPPDSMRTQTVPLLQFLDHIRANYDLTTDVDLVRGGGLAAGPCFGYRGVVFAGSERWLTDQVAAALRRCVTGGGNVASFGIDAFRRRVAYGHGLLARPRPPQPANFLSERTATFTSPQAPLVVSQNKLDLFPGSDGFIGSFTRFERSDGLGRGSELLVAAGREQPGTPGQGVKPDLVAYRLGRGLVIRVGTDQWPSQLIASGEVAATTRRIWTLLSQ